MARKTIYDVGAEIFAKWPGSQMYYPGTVVEGYDESNDSYKVKFDNEGEPVAVLARNITNPRQAKSWRSRSASPARTPGRRSRRRSQSKSPTRASRRRSPARQRSSGRKQKKSLEEQSPVKNEEETQQNQSQSDQVDNVVNVEEKQEVISQSQHVSQEETSTTVVTKRVTRSVARIQQQAIQQQAAGIKQSADAKEEKKKDEELPVHGWSCQIVALLTIILVPLGFMALYFVFGDKQQAFSFTKWPKIPQVSAFLNWRAFLLLGIWYDFQFILTRVPLGKIEEGRVAPDGEQKNYRLNGAIHLFIHAIIVAIGVYTKFAFKVAALVDEYYLSIAASSILAAFLTAVLVYVKALLDKNVADKSITPESFLSGKELNATIFGFDVKWCSARAGFIGWVFLDCLFLINHYADVKGNVNCAAVYVAIAHLLYLLTSLSMENVMAKTPLLNDMATGFGLTLMSLSFTPLFYSAQVLYLVRFKPVPTHFQWAASIVFQLCGTYIFLKSNLEKAEFRSDPKKAMKRDVKVVFTANGNNLLADGWWGRLRHPNYLGDILMGLSWAIPAGCSHIAPWLHFIFLVTMLVFLAVKDEKRCAKKYGLSWDEYKSRVKYVIFPYVY